MKKSSNYYEQLRKDLRDPDEASAYLNATLETGDIQDFLFALRNVVLARGNVSKISRRTKLNRANLYRILSKRGNPEVLTLKRLLNVLGLKLAITTKSSGTEHKKMAA